MIKCNLYIDVELAFEVRRQPCESSGRMESVSSPLRPFLALGADKFRNIVMSTNTFCFEA